MNDNNQNEALQNIIVDTLAILLRDAYNKILPGLGTIEKSLNESVPQVAGRLKLSDGFKAECGCVLCKFAASDGKVTEREIRLVNKVLENNFSMEDVQNHDWSILENGSPVIEMAVFCDTLLHQIAPGEEIPCFAEQIYDYLALCAESVLFVEGMNADQKQMLESYKTKSAELINGKDPYLQTPIDPTKTFVDFTNHTTVAGLFAQNENGADSDAAKKDAAKKESVEELLKELDDLVGLDSVKQDVHSLINFIKVARIRKDRGMTVPTVSYHLVFTGNPGTGKTTVARLIAQLYQRMGIIPKGQLVETDRSGLVAGYLGQTALKTQSVIETALGGVLFIDEAYALINRDDDMYGKEAIETLLKAMEDHRDELVVIVAGYTGLMHKFIDSNPGLASRFNKYFDFPDYTGEELLTIFHRFCKKNGYVLEPAAESILSKRLNEMYLNRKVHFGNGRTVRNIFEKAINVQADRIAGLADISDDDLKILTEGDMKTALETVS